MTTGPEYIRQQAIQAAAKRLRDAATFTRLNIRQPVFQKRMGKGANSVLVWYCWPGVVQVFDPQTGELLAESEAGRPDALRSGFVPPTPSLHG